MPPTCRPRQVRFHLPKPSHTISSVSDVGLSPGILHTLQRSDARCRCGAGWRATCVAVTQQAGQPDSGRSQEVSAASCCMPRPKLKPLKHGRRGVWQVQNPMHSCRSGAFCAQLERRPRWQLPIPRPLPLLIPWQAAPQLAAGSDSAISALPGQRPPSGGVQGLTPAAGAAAGNTM